MIRKIIQILCDPTTGKIIALCNDGTVWIKNNEWIQISTTKITDLNGGN